MKPNHWIAAIAMILGLLTSASAEAQEKPRLTVFAAASMKNALDAANSEWRRIAKGDVVVSYAASSTLANQIERGAPADIFISADLDWMNYLTAKGQIKPDSVSHLFGNRLVLVAPKDQAAAIEIKVGFDILGLLGDGKIAMGIINAVPAGKYGKAALEKLGAWDKVSTQIAQADSVRAALLLVSRREAALGIVYQTDAAADANVAIIGTFPPDSHPAIIYPVAITTTSQHPEAEAYLTFLRSIQARPFFERQGFTVLPGQKS